MNGERPEFPGSNPFAGMRPDSTSFVRTLSMTISKNSVQLTNPVRAIRVEFIASPRPTRRTPGVPSVCLSGREPVTTKRDDLPPGAATQAVGRRGLRGAGSGQARIAISTLSSRLARGAPSLACMDMPW